MGYKFKIKCEECNGFVEVEQHELPSQENPVEYPNHTGHTLDYNTVQFVFRKTTADVDSCINELIGGVTQPGRIIRSGSESDHCIVWSDIIIDCAIITDTKSQGTDGGTFTSGVWDKRELNTIEETNSFATIASNEITLPSGKYLIKAKVPAYSVGLHQGRLYNETDTIVVKYGNTNDSGSGNSVLQNFSYINTIIDINSTKNYSIQHYGTTTQNANGYGIAGNLGDEIYTEVVIQKIN